MTVLVLAFFGGLCAVVGFAAGMYAAMRILTRDLRKPSDWF